MAKLTQHFTIKKPTPEVRARLITINSNAASVKDHLPKFHYCSPTIPYPAIF